MKKILLAILVLFAAMTYGQNTNLVFTDDFENGNTTDWKSERLTITYREAAQGKRALEVKSGSKVQRTVMLKENSRYRLSAYLKTAVGAEEIQLNVEGLKFNNTGLASALSGWTKKELIFQTSEKQTNALVELYHPISSVGNSAWADDITLEYLGVAVHEKQSGIKPMPVRNVKEDMGIAQQPSEKLSWMQDAKFGLFIHWGLYAGPAQGEWYMRNKAVSIADYRKLAYPESGESQFLGDKFDASAWAQLAKDAGMKYMSLTTQHHDGYALFRSKYPDSFNSYQTHNRDFVREYVDACRAAGLRVGLYKTLINWRYPGYYDVTGTDCKKNSWNYKTNISNKESARQMKEELYCMTKELLSNYGKIDQIFWDGGWISEQGSDADGSYFWESGKYLNASNQWPIDPRYTEKDKANGKDLGIMGLVRQLQPDILVNPRCGWRGDYVCEEGGAKISGPVRTSEICEKALSLHHAWGYTPLAENPEKVINANRVKVFLADCLMRNMCLMINVGPDRHGVIPKAEADVLREVGAWINKVQEAVYGTRGGPWNPTDEQFGYAYKSNKIYIYLLQGYQGTSFTMPSTDKLKVKRVYDVSDKSALKFKQNSKGETTITGINRDKNPIVTVLAVELNKDVY